MSRDKAAMLYCPKCAGHYPIDMIGVNTCSFCQASLSLVTGTHTEVADKQQKLIDSGGECYLQEETSK
jgi:hypothetical protein